MSVPVSDLQQIAPSAVIELYELELNATQHSINETYRFHAGSSLNANGEVVWAGNSYMRFPIETDGFDYSGNGQLPRPKVRISNILGTITALLLSLPSGLEGAKFTRIRTLARYIDGSNFSGGTNPYGTPDPTAEFPREVYYVDRKTLESRDIVEFELAASFDLVGVRGPKRQCIANICQWQYRSTECGYIGNAYFDANDQAVTSLAADVCGKRLSSCQLRFDEINRVGTVSVGSNLLTLDNPLAASTGDLIRGFGIPSGTTVVSYSGNAITMTANATATTTVTKTGTLQTNLTQIVVSNTTGLAPGMVVTGPNILAGTTVISISGTTLTLGQPADLWNVVIPVTTRSTYLASLGGSWDNRGYAYSGSTVSNQTGSLNTTGLSIGMYVVGPTIPRAVKATISAVYRGYSTYYTIQSGYLTFTYSGTVAGSTGTYTFYQVPAQAAQTYTFTAASRNYTFRSGGELPFGSYPGIGTFFG